MSRLNELIQQYCPDGVEYKKIKEVYQRIKGTPITAGKMKEIQCPTGEIRIFAGGKTMIDANEADIPNANITRVPSVLVQSRGVIDAIYYDKPFTFKNEMWAYTHKEQTSVKFLYYVMKQNIQHFRDAASGMGALPQISLGTTEDFVIPVPPLPVQEEIVRILDTLTELQAELQAELQKRLQQYNYYRDNLLSFEGRTDVEWKKLGDVVSISRGASPRPIQNYLTNEEDGIPWIKIGDVSTNSKYITSTAERITREGASKSRFLNKGTFILSNSMSFGRPYILGIDGCIHDGWISICDFEASLNSDFLYYLLRSSDVQGYWISKANSGGAVANLNSDIVRSTPIPVPPLAEQQRIVDILDRFSTLTTDITAGLPAEIEARRKQYEYYREQLLTFKQKA